MEPDTELAQHTKNELRNRHILINTDGPRDSVLKIKPPLRFSKEDVFRINSAGVSLLPDSYSVPGSWLAK